MKYLNKTLLLIAFLAVAIIPAKAVSRGEVTGQVLEQENMKPVAYAEVVFENGAGKIKVSANEYGFYTSPLMPTGRYQMSVVFNNRTFVMNKVKVLDSYVSEVNFIVSHNNDLPVVVEVIKREQMVNLLESGNIKETVGAEKSNGAHTPAVTLNWRHTVDVKDGRIYVAGSDDIRFFIDGTPVVAPGPPGRKVDMN